MQKKKGILCEQLWFFFHAWLFRASDFMVQDNLLSVELVATAPVICGHGQKLRFG